MCCVLAKIRLLLLTTAIKSIVFEIKSKVNREEKILTGNESFLLFMVLRKNKLGLTIDKKPYECFSLISRPSPVQLDGQRIAFMK